MRHIVETRLESGGLEVVGPGVVWARIAGEVVRGIPVSPFVQLAMAADFGSGTSRYVALREWRFAHVAISTHLTPLPQRQWTPIPPQDPRPVHASPRLYPPTV